MDVCKWYIFYKVRKFGGFKFDNVFVVVIVEMR